MTSRKQSKKAVKKAAKKAKRKVLVGGLDKGNAKTPSAKEMRAALGEPKGGKCAGCGKRVTRDDWCFGCEHHVCQECSPHDVSPVGPHSIEDHFPKKETGGPRKAPEKPAPKVTLDAAKTPQAPVEPKKGVDPNTIPVPSRVEWDMVVEQTAKVGDLSRKESQTKAAHKAAKDLLDEAQEQLNSMLLELQDVSRHTDKLPFPNTPAATLSMAADKPAAEPDAWKAASIDALSLGPALTELLKQRAIYTLGDLSRVMEKGGQDWYKEVRGVGIGKAEKIGDALAQYWKDHPEVKTDAPKPAEPSEEPAPVNPGAPDTFPIVDLAIDQRLKEVLAKPATVTLQGGHKREKPEWLTVGDIRGRKLGQRSGGEEGDGEINAGRLASIPGISPADESIILEAISKWSAAPDTAPSGEGAEQGTSPH